MAEIKEFKYTFQDSSKDGCLSIETEASSDKKIEIDIEEGRKVWISANKAGWLHLARICVELGLGDYEPGFHFHQDLTFHSGEAKGPEISFEVSA